MKDSTLRQLAMYAATAFVVGIASYGSCIAGYEAGKRAVPIQDCTMFQPFCDEGALEDSIKRMEETCRSMKKRPYLEAWIGKQSFEDPREDIKRQ
ncbi:hypothetical protein KY363_04870 [Candidatus Woesearchaeota archaeon]|nr:hypothetical protein [Candidatus Woesearchaeota archaeon]